MQLAQEKNTVFKLTWKIHNFLMIPYKVDEPLWSPKVVIGLFEGSEWNFGLYPRGYKNDYYITGLVFRGKSEKGAETEPVSLKIFFKNVDGSSSLIFEKEYKFKRSTGHGFRLILQKDVFQDKKFLLSGDTLTVEYQMRKCIVENPFTLESTLRNCAFDPEFVLEPARKVINKVFKPDISECQIRTRINVEDLKYIWAIPRFCTAKSGQKFSVPVSFACESSPKFVLSIIPNIATSETEGKVHVELQAESKESFYCSYEILLVDCDYVSRIHMKGEHLFEIGTSMSYTVPNSLNFSELQRNKHLHLVDETLTLYCKLEISSSASVKTFIEKTSYFPPNIGVCSLKSDSNEDDEPNCHINRHNKERKFSDVSLQVDGKLLRAHKVILCNCSSVFKSILEQDLPEDCHILDIEGIDVDTADRMLLFMYNNTVEDLDWKETAKLYLSANKYQIMSLLENCSNSLESKISITNVCELLFLADMHENEELMKFATDFIEEHKEEVLRTEEWENLMKSNGALAAKLMHKMFVKA